MLYIIDRSFELSCGVLKLEVGSGTDEDVSLQHPFLGYLICASLEGHRLPNMVSKEHVK